MISKNISNSILAAGAVATMLVWSARGAAHGGGGAVADRLVHAALSAGSVERFLHGLPPELRGSYVLAARPLGSHVGTPSRPRALLFDERVIVSFGACPGSAGHDHVEMMDLERLRPRMIDVSLERGNSGARFESESCRHCHGTMNRPLWPTGAILPGWAGFYGASLSGLTGDRESELLEEFKALAVDHPRYSALIGVPDLAAYFDRGGTKILYEANQKFEAVIARAVARNAFGYLRSHPNFERARIPLLIALNSFDVPALDYARILAPWVSRSAAAVREALGRREPNVTAAIARHAAWKWQFLEHGLGASVADEARAPFEAARSPARLARSATLLSLVAEMYGLDRLEELLTTSRRTGTFAYPGHRRYESGPAQLERILFKDAMAQTFLAESDVGRVGRAQTSSWASARDFEAGLARLSSALGHPRSCEFDFEN